MRCWFASLVFLVVVLSSIVLAGNPEYDHQLLESMRNQDTEAVIALLQERESLQQVIRSGTLTKVLAKASKETPNLIQELSTREAFDTALYINSMSDRFIQAVNDNDHARINAFLGTPDSLNFLTPETPLRALRTAILLDKTPLAEILLKDQHFVSLVTMDVSSMELIYKHIATEGQMSLLRLFFGRDAWMNQMGAWQLGHDTLNAAERGQTGAAHLLTSHPEHRYQISLQNYQDLLAFAVEHTDVRLFRQIYMDSQAPVTNAPDQHRKAAQNIQRSLKDMSEVLGDESLYRKLGAAFNSLALDGDTEFFRTILSNEHLVKSLKDAEVMTEALKGALMGGNQNSLIELLLRSNPGNWITPADIVTGFSLSAAIGYTDVAVLFLNKEAFPKPVWDEFASFLTESLREQTRIGDESFPSWSLNRESLSTEHLAKHHIWGEVLKKAADANQVKIVQLILEANPPHRHLSPYDAGQAFTRSVVRDNTGTFTYFLGNKEFMALVPETFIADAFANVVFHGKLDVVPLFLRREGTRHKIHSLRGLTEKAILANRMDIVQDMLSDETFIANLYDLDVRTMLRSLFNHGKTKELRKIKSYKRLQASLPTISWNHLQKSESTVGFQYNKGKHGILPKVDSAFGPESPKIMAIRQKTASGSFLGGSHGPMDLTSRTVSDPVFVDKPAYDVRARVRLLICDASSTFNSYGRLWNKRKMQMMVAPKRNLAILSSKPMRLRLLQT